ncbi:sensor histidine kinase KdpD [Glycomyces sp. NRRL B-16210]|uniref:sensor histidine kinase n=1 Tax=Glycomyces sp. NRRL B-16210 TaxID=1463821 RepID=UPI0006925FA8|nr:ATP-binding protein [Glycomyces sp. NRRL B-16210]
MALLPIGVAVFAGAGIAIYLVAAAADQPAWMSPVVFGSASVLLLLTGFLAFSSATKIESDLRRRIGAVRRSTVETHYKVWQILDDLQRATPPDQRWSVPLPNPGVSARNVDETIALLAAEARHLRAAAESVAARNVQAAPAQPIAPAALVSPPPAPIAAAANAADEPGVGIFVNRARRLQVLAHREIVELDFLERQVEDPELLKGLFSVDHLATRVRRHAENLAVLGGGPSHRQWSRPVNVYEALRSSVAEVEHYARVKLARPIDGTLKGHAVADFIHLVAELIENATLFSPPNSQVLIRVEHVSAGMAVEVEDRGLGMAKEDREFYNGILSTPAEVDLEALLADGRIGLYVVALLARRHKFAVQLQSNIFGGTQAVVVVPEAVLGGERSVNEPKEIEAVEPSPQLPSVRLGGTEQHSRPQPVAGPRTGPIDAPAYAPRAIEPARPSEPDDRPALPKRSRQSHLAPQLRDGSQHGGAGSESGHDPGLMRAFQQGQHRAGDQVSDSSVTPYQDEEA